MSGGWTAASAETRTRGHALLLAAGATACWMWFGYAVHGAGDDGWDVAAVGVSVSLALAVVLTVFSAAMTVVSCLSSVAASSVAAAASATASATDGADR